MHEDIDVHPLCHDGSPYVVIAAKDGASNLLKWAEQHRHALKAMLLQHKALVFRHFTAVDERLFSDFVHAMTTPVDYTYRSTPRTSVGKHIYTATEFPKEQTIPVHCENAYQRRWPARIFFYCQTAATQGGQTPLADVSAVTKALDPAVRARFTDKNVLYVRNYGSGIDLPWQTVFQTADKSTVERFCLDNDIAFSWKTAEKLQTRQIRPAMATHPISGELLWFNQAHLFNVHSLDQPVRSAMLSIFALDDLPRNSYYGDGSPIEPDVLDHIQETFVRCTSVFDWQQGDILMADNMLVAHGRKPFSGPRKVLVMMGDVVDGAQ